jgi:uncharacterized repeat protein (TIGR03803 family)
MYTDSPNEAKLYNMPNMQQGGGWFSIRWRQVIGVLAPAGVLLSAWRSTRSVQRSGLLLIACALAGVGIAHAQPTEVVLHNFCAQANCADGGVGVAGLTSDSVGNLYGTTLLGGAGEFVPPGPVGCGAGPGCGVVFKLDKAGNYTVLYSFCGQLNCADGQSPYGGVVLDPAGNLYGTTFYGGGPGGGYLCAFAGSCNGAGVVFKLDTAGNYTVLHNFCSLQGCADGALPKGNLARDSVGNLYGIASYGVSGKSTVFKLDAAGNFSVLYTFYQAWWVDNGEPSLVLDSAGNLYGASPFGGAYKSDTSYGGGVIFTLSQTGQYQALYSFPNSGAAGSNPVGGVIRDAAGNLYGTTYGGGSAAGGVVFRLDTAGNYTVLYNFCSAAAVTGSCSDGRNPVGGLLLDSAGNLFGTTGLGGANESGCFGCTGGGVVFELDTTGNYTVLNSFPRVVPTPAVGYFPQSNLISDSAGNLYGTTYAGGAGNGGGVVFELSLGMSPTTITLASSSNPSIFGGSLTLTATVSGAGAGTPTGTVTFMNGTTPLALVTMFGGVATLNFSFVCPLVVTQPPLLCVRDLAAGTYSITAVYSGDSTFSASTSSPLNQVINRAVPTLSWNTPAPIVYGTPLTQTQLDATSIPGMFAYTPPAGTVLAAGTQTLSVTFTPTDTTDFTNATATTSITVSKATPLITWPAPVAITYGTALSTAQLTATATATGTFVYSPQVGTVLPAGSQTVSVIFTPADTADYTTATASTTISVNKAVLTVTANPIARPYGMVNPTLTATISGFVNGDTASVVSGAPALATAATPASLPGAYPITTGLGTLMANNYGFNLVGGTLTVAVTASVPSSRSSCNGAYSGTFNGNLTVSNGQNCIFVSGGVTGNVRQDGGNLILIQSQVGGDVQVNGGGTFTVGPGTTIMGNLQILSLPGGPGQNQVCGSTVNGDLRFHNNGTAVEIGSASPGLCAGNTIGGNLTVLDNTAPAIAVGNTVGNNLTVRDNSAATTVDGNNVTDDLQDQDNAGPTQVFNNVVGNNLQCRNDTSITGGGNTAMQKHGQCSGF